jgi:hypothetical protein
MQKLIFKRIPDARHPPPVAVNLSPKLPLLSRSNNAYALYNPAKHKYQGQDFSKMNPNKSRNSHIFTS